MAQVSSLRHLLDLAGKDSKKVIQKKKIYYKGRESLSLAPSTLTPDCRSCFESAGIQIEAEDERGWIFYRDDNAFDDRAGSFTLTEKFWQEALPLTGGQSRIPEHAADFPGRRLKRIRLDSEKALRAGIGLSGYELEMAYSPLGLRGKTWSIDIDLRSRLSYDSEALFFPRQVDFSPAYFRYDLSMGLTVRW